MAVFDKFDKSWVYTYGSENAVGSFYLWFKRLFDHDNGYTVVYDKQLSDPEVRKALPFPCIVLNQIDTTDPSSGYFSGKRDKNGILLYIYCMHNKAEPYFGTTRLVRRMKDQVVFALKHAGDFAEEHQDLLVPPIFLYDMSQKPPVQLRSILALSSNITQHLSEDNELLEYELMANFTFVEYPQGE